MNEVLAFIEKNYDNFLEELKDYIRIPSISALSEHKDDMIKCANFAADKLKAAGMENVRLIETEGNPLVYAEWLHAENKPTILVYGHYDVQPVDPIELWESDPFEPVIKDGKIWARGADDDKGQSFIHIKSIEAFMKTKKELPLNVKVILEGEEEVGSESLTKFLNEENSKEILKCDAILISDTSLYDDDIPTINYGLRGLTFMEIELTGPNRDLHSGSFGGAVANPINELAKLIAKLTDENNKITIPGFYDSVQELTNEEKENFLNLNFSDEKFAKELNVEQLQGEKGFSTLERLWTRPTLDCNGIVGGFTGEGAKTVLPSKASAKISMRLVPNQDPKEIAKLFTDYVESLCPKSMKIKVTEMHGGRAVVVPLNEKAIKAASEAVSKVFGKKTVYTREGGSIPIVVEFMTQLNAPAVLMGMGLETDNIHSPNEHFKVDSFNKGILCSAHFMDIFSKI